MEPLAAADITEGMNAFRRIHLKIVLLVLAGLAALAAGAGVALAGRTAVPIGQGVVVIETNLAYQDAAAAGTGIVLTPSGEVLTNNHVIAGATTVKVVIPNTGRSYTARVTGYSRTADVALLQLQNASNLKTLRTGDAAALTVGQAVRALGNAGGTGSLSSASGTITGLSRSITASDDQGNSEQLTGLIETNAGVVAGDSGGPLLDTTGRIVGMDVAASASGGFQMVETSDAYAIPIGKALTIAKQVESGTSSATVHVGATAFLGVQVESAASGGYPGDGYGSTTAGALLAGVIPGGPASSAGLVPGDVITAINGRPISSPTVISSIVLKLKPGVKVTITYSDQTGVSQSVPVTLGSGPPQ
jgi:Trypsin-like serine proteases, typically periplasmic, contain C-terminal PDZ domain